ERSTRTRWHVVCDGDYAVVSSYRPADACAHRLRQPAPPWVRDRCPVLFSSGDALIPENCFGKQLTEQLRTSRPLPGPRCWTCGSLASRLGAVGRQMGRRSASRVLQCALVACLVCVASSARADSMLQLDWRAPPGCPTGSDVSARADRLAQVAASGSPLV